MNMTPIELRAAFDRAIPFAGDPAAGTFYRALFIGGAWDVICATRGGLPYSHLEYRVPGSAHDYFPAFAELRRRLRADGWPSLREPRPRYRTGRRTATA
jgi:hypothetical protein